jgi:hypothetical protein
LELDKLNNILMSIIGLRNEMEKTKKLEEAHIEWLQTDIQSLVIIAEQWEIEFYNES